MIIKQIIPMEDWGVHFMIEKPILLNQSRVNCTYWDYIDAFDTVLYYNNERHKHTWFIKVCSNVFKEKLPN